MRPHALHRNILGVPCGLLMQLAPGTMIQQKYEIECNLGEGSTSIVYRAKDIDLNKLVALKFLRPELAVLPSRRKRFWHESQIAARFLHPAVMPVRAIGEWQNTLYLVMDYHPGQTLRTILKQRKLTLQEVESLAKQMLTCLADAHKVGLIHGDIKPANLMIKQEEQQLKLSIVDFGLASTAEEETIKEAAGTPNYMAPELLLGDPPSPISDLYSAALCIYQMLTNHLPIRHPNENPLLYVLHNDPVPPSHHRRIPRQLDKVMAKALHQDPSARFANAEEFRTALETAWSSSYSWSRWQIFGTLILVLSVVFILGWGIWQQRQQRYYQEFQQAIQALQQKNFRQVREWAVIWRYKKLEARELLWKSLWYEFMSLLDRSESEMQQFFQDAIWHDPEFLALQSYLQFYHAQYRIKKDWEQEHYQQAIDRCNQFSGLPSQNQILQQIGKRMKVRAQNNNP